MRRMVFCFAVMAVAVLLSIASANAQECVNGRCKIAAGVAEVAHSATEVVVSVIETPARVIEHVVCDIQPVRSTACYLGLAQSKAERQAREGRMRHVGGGFGGGRYEGVGFSTYSAESAVRACCYWGKRPVREIGVARGARGWFACVIYE